MRLSDMRHSVSVSEAMEIADLSSPIEKITVYGLLVSRSGEIESVPNDLESIRAVFTPYLLRWPVDPATNLLDASDYYETNNGIYVDHKDFVDRFLKAGGTTWLGTIYIIKMPALITGRIVPSRLPQFKWAITALETAYIEPGFGDDDDHLAPVSLFEPIVD